MNESLLHPHLRVFATSVLVAFVGWVLYLIRYHRLSLRDSLLWLVSTIAALGVTVFPAVLEFFTRAIGIATPVNALFALTFLYVLLNLLSMTIGLSENSARVRRLTQECSILRAEIDDLRRRLAPAQVSRPVRSPHEQP